MRLTTRYVSLLLIALFALTAASSAESDRIEDWDDFEVFIETCGTDLDAGFKGLLSGARWTRAAIFAPDGRRIYRLRSQLADVGSDTVFLEGAEPPFDVLPLDAFLDRFPAGEYTALGRTVDGAVLAGRAELTHDLLAGPTITSHEDGEIIELEGENVVVTWDEVTEGFRGGPLGSRVVAYILTVTYEIEALGDVVEREMTIDVIPPDRFSAEIPADFLEADTELQIEVAAREESGNRTSKEVFVDVVDGELDR